MEKNEDGLAELDSFKRHGWYIPLLVCSKTFSLPRRCDGGNGTELFCMIIVWRDFAVAPDCIAAFAYVLGQCMQAGSGFLSVSRVTRPCQRVRHKNCLRYLMSKHAFLHQVLLPDDDRQASGGERGSRGGQ